MNKKFIDHLFCVLTTVFLLGIPAAVFAQLTDIETAIIEKDFAKAEIRAQAFLESKPKANADQARYYLALSRLNLEKIKEARQLFGELARKTKVRDLRDQAQLGVVDSYYLEGNYPQALTEAQKLSKVKPHSQFLSLIYLKIARANLKLTNWTEAKTYLSRIVNEFPNSVERKLAEQLLEEKQYFAVQLGAFIDSSRAEGLMGELNDRGEYAYIIETTDADGKRFYRVRVGQLSTLKEAESLKNKMAKLGYPTRIYP